MGSGFFYWLSSIVDIVSAFLRLSRDYFLNMLDNEILKKKIYKYIRPLKLKKAEEDKVVKELNYLSNLLIEVYIDKSQNE